MLSDFGLGLIVPAVGLVIVAWAVPKWLRWRMPEGVWPLIALSVLATLINLAICALMFLMLYLLQGAQLSTLTLAGPGAAIWYFLRLSISAAIIWGPIMVLSIASLPRTWTQETW